MPSVQVYLRDHGAQLVTTGIPVPAGLSTVDANGIADAINEWSIGREDGADHCVELQPRIGLGATTPLAQSGFFGYIVLRDDVTGRTFTERLPMPDLGKADDVDGDPAWIADQDASGRSISVMNPDHADYGLFQLGFNNTNIVNPRTGNPASLVRVYVPNKL